MNIGIFVLLFVSAAVPSSSGFQALAPQSIRFESQHQHFPSTLLYQAESDNVDETVVASQISIQYCTGCRWMLKSFWMAQELLSTFEKDQLTAVTVLPSFDTKGIFVVKLNKDNGDASQVLWDRKEQGGFPQPKELKQVVRDLVQPDKFLGHSDTSERQELFDGKQLESADANAVVELPEKDLGFLEAPQPSVTIHYCTGCKWLLRAAYFGQELLTTFSEGEIKSVTLVPSKPPSKGGRFTIELNGETLFDRASEGRFPEVKEIKQMIRDKIVPQKDLGHSDVQGLAKAGGDDVFELDDDEAEEARKFFGVL